MCISLFLLTPSTGFSFDSTTRSKGSIVTSTVLPRPNVMRVQPPVSFLFTWICTACSVFSRMMSVSGGRVGATVR